MSDTPRTEHVWKAAMENYPARLPEGIANFARILERELAAEKAKLNAVLTDANDKGSLPYWQRKATDAMAEVKGVSFSTIQRVVAGKTWNHK